MLIGIVGKPSCGKSTFFKAATLANVEIANYPFTTIKPNHAVAFVKVEDAAKDFDKISNPREGYTQEGFRFVPIDLLDVAGLVEGAHEGHGMGNAFLEDLRPAHALIHVIDISGSTNIKGEPVDTLSHDPAEDIKFLEYELNMWYKQIMQKGWEKFVRSIRAEKQEVHKAIAKQLSALRVTEEMVQKAIKVLELENDPSKWNEESLTKLASNLRKQTKPMIIACNKIDVPGAEEKLKKLQEQFPDYIMVPCSAESEVALKEAAKHKLIKYIPGDNDFTITQPEKLNEKQTQALNFIKENILKKFNTTGVQDVLNKTTFELLKLIAIHPGGVSKLEDSEGNVLPDCFLMPQGSTALDFAYRLHTDFGKNFIRAIDVKTKRTVGKDHLLNHLDIVEIVADK
jgi:ribosome-binding ATPase